MKVTINIAESKLEKLAALLVGTKRRVAVAKKVQEIRRRTKAAEFGRKLRVGAFDYGSTHDEIEAWGS